MTFKARVLGRLSVREWGQMLEIEMMMHLKTGEEGSEWCSVANLFIYNFFSSKNLGRQNPRTKKNIYIYLLPQVF